MCFRVGHLILCVVLAAMFEYALTKKSGPVSSDLVL